MPETTSSPSSQTPSATPSVTSSATPSPAACPATLLSIAALIDAHQTRLGLSDQDLCLAAGIDKLIVLQLIKNGSMKLPLNWIPALASALGVPTIDLLRAALHETSPDLLQLIDNAFNPLCLSASETHLIKHLRQLSGNAPVSPLVFDGKGVIALVAA